MKINPVTALAVNLLLTRISFVSLFDHIEKIELKRS